MMPVNHFVNTHDSRVDTVQLSMRGHHLKPFTGLLLSASKDGTVKYWDIVR